MGGRHAGNIYQRINGAHLAGVFDINEERANTVAFACGNVPVFASGEDLITNEIVDAVLIATFDSVDYGHADEWEVSEMLHIYPELVHMDKAAEVKEPPRDRLKHLPNTYTSMDWFSRQPDLTRGTPGLATAEKGKIFWEQQIKTLASLVKAIKEDKVAKELYEEFNKRVYRK